MAGGTGTGWEVPGSTGAPSAPAMGAGTGTGWEVPGGAPAPAAHSGGGIGGLLGGAAHWLASKAALAGDDLKAIPGGLYDMGKTEAQQIAQTVRHPIVSGTSDPNYVGNVPSGQHANAIVHGIVDSAKEAVQHPLRDPFNTLTWVLPATHGLGKIADVAGVIPEGARTLKINGGAQSLEPSSHPIARAVQAAHDAVVQRALDEKPQGRIAQYGAKRISGAMAETRRAQARVLDTLPKQLEAVGSKLSKAEQHALRLVSEGSTPEESAQYHLLQAEKGIAPAENRAASALSQKVAKLGFVTTNENGHAVIDAARFPKLAEADAKLAEVQSEADRALHERGVMQPEDLKARVDGPARVRSGATFEKPTPTKLGNSPALVRATIERDRLASLHERALSQEARWMEAQKGKVAETAGRTGGASLALDNPYRERINNLGSAVEVAQQKVDRLAKTYAPKPVGFVGGETAPEGRGYVPYNAFEPKAAKAAMSRAVGPVVGEARSPIAKTQVFEGRNLAHGKIPDDTTGLVARHLRNVNAFVKTDDFRRSLINFGSPARRSDRDVLVRIPGEGSGTIAPEIREVLGQQRSTLNTLDEAASPTRLEEFIAKLFPGQAEGSDARAIQEQSGVGTPAPEGTVWVDSSLIGKLLGMARDEPGKIGRFLDNVNTAITEATVYFKPGHLPTRVLTNSAANMLQGSLRPVDIGRSVRTWQELSALDKMKALGLAGTNFSEAAPGAEGKTIMARVAQHGINVPGLASRSEFFNRLGSPEWWAHHIDAPNRFNSFAFEARKAGYKGADGIRRLIHDATDGYESLPVDQRAKVDGVLRRANREAIAYDRLSEAEKRYLSRGIWFYPWVKGSTAFTVRSMIEHPYKFGTLQSAGQFAQGEQRQALGDLPSYERGLIPLGGNRVADLSTFNPFSTAGDVLNLPAHTQEIAGMLNPALGAIDEIAHRENSYGSHTNKPLSTALSDLIAPTPEGQLAADYLNRHKDQSGHMFQHSYWLDLLRGLAGPSLPRTINIPAANSSAAREKAGR